MRGKPTMPRPALVALAILAALTFPAAAAADSISLSIAPAPVKSVTSEVSWSAESEEGRFEVVYVNNPGVPCGADPEADNGTRISEQHGLEAGASGSYGGALNFTPTTTGDYEVCAWLVIPAGLFDLEGGPVTAAASLPIDVRAPYIHLALSVPRHPVPRRAFTIDLTAFSEASREFVVEGFPDTHRGCPVDSTAETLAPELIDQEDSGGPWRFAGNVEPLTAGTYIFCTWANPPEGQLYPEASAHLIVHIGATPARHRKPRRRR